MTQVSATRLEPLDYESRTLPLGYTTPRRHYNEDDIDPARQRSYQPQNRVEKVALVICMTTPTK